MSAGCPSCDPVDPLAEARAEHKQELFALFVAGVAFLGALARTSIARRRMYELEMDAAATWAAAIEQEKTTDALPEPQPDAAAAP